MNRILLGLTAVLLAAPLAAQHDHGAQAGHQQPAAAKAASAPTFLPQSSCPISGEKLTGGPDETEVVYEGQKIRLCCAKCEKKFAEFPDGYLYAMFQAGEKPQNVQTTCPVTGEDLGADAVSVWAMNKELRVCCKKCAAKVAKDPASWFDELEGRKPQTHCPVMGGEIDPEVFSVVQGQKVFYCCPGCDKKMKADPGKFFAKAAAEGVVFESASKLCPVMGDPIEDPSWWVSYQGRRIHFCCKKCVGRFIKDPAKYLG
ncbi:MAG: hypothetical protein ISR76_01410 [Planctomycetes bacterium]|nr:hypothetical protein [Planctomycetota bacterium]MBL7007627.1 hypothetical protein [Planctomycetota bacterium]